MEKFWDNKRIRLLLKADTDTVEEFISQFVPVIYTWLYYQVGADVKITAELTAHTFTQAVKNISSFDPANQTLFQWLKEQAAQTRDEELEKLQMKPQRPWAWSQLPDEILCELSRFRCGLLDDKVLGNSFVHEIVQAAIAELDSRDRELMTHRFCHLDNESHIAEEMNCRVEDIQNWLYRSRHAFRRVFFQLIASSNNGFSESSDTGDIEIQDTNLEKVLSTTPLHQVLDDAQMDIIRSQITQSLKEAEQLLPKEKKQSKFVIFGIGLAVIAALLIGVFRIIDNDMAESPLPPVAETNTTYQDSDQEPALPKSRDVTQDDIDEEELRRVFALGQAGNVDALLEILKSGQFVSQRIAAPFLGKLADPDAIDLLELAGEHWYPESPDNNPFTDAIEQILVRFPDAAPPPVIEEAESEPQKTEIAKEPNQPPAVIPKITGLVTDFSNQAISNAELELMEKPLFSKIGTGRKIASAKTNPLGQYHFSDIYNGPISLTCRIPAENLKVITQPLWCGKDSTCILNFGGRPALTGMAVIDGRPLAGQALYLSDTIDMTDASFIEEVVTDSQGNFLFLGVSPGVYSIMNRGLDNRIHRLATIEIPQQDMVNVNMNIETVAVWLDDTSLREEMGVSKAILVYALDISDNLSQVQASISEAGSILFENVIPGNYVLRVQIESNIWLQQNVEIAAGLIEQTIQLGPVTEQTSELYGQFLSAASIDLFLTSIDQNIHIDLTPYANGAYELTNVPSDIYSLTAFIKGRLIRFTEIDLQTESEVTLDIDPSEMTLAYSPLHVVVADASGVILSNAQVWLTGTGSEDLITASSTGQGAFLAAEAGSYTLSVAHPNYPTVNREIVLKSSNLLAEPDSENTIVIQLGTQK